MEERPLLAVARLAALALAGAGCALSGNVAPPVTPAMVGAARGISEKTLNAGRTVFAGPCTACHNADPVSRYPFNEWKAIIDDDMAQRAKLDSASRSALLAYIAAAQKVTAPPPR